MSTIVAKQTLIQQYAAQAIGQTFTAVSLHVHQQGQPPLTWAGGQVNPEAGPWPATNDTVFDLASLTKLFVTTALLRLLAAQNLSVDEKVAAFLPEFSGPRPLAPYEDPLHPGQMITIQKEGGPIDASTITLRQVLSHSAGLPAWRPLYRMPADQRREAVLHTALAYFPGRRVVYSDIGFILLGWVVEALSGQPLADALRTWVAEPLGLPSVHYRAAQPPPPAVQQGTAATEVCPWRGRRIWGEVHDENAWSLRGVSGHAGLFATAADVAGLGRAWLEALQGHPKHRSWAALAREAVRLQAQEGDTRRGLGWALWSSAPTSISRPLSPSSFGHTGFTGTSLYIDPPRGLVVAALTNRVYFGRAPEPICRWRQGFHALLAGLFPLPEGAA